MCHLVTSHSTYVNKVLFCNSINSSLVQLHTVSQKNDTDVAHYNFNALQPIWVIFGRDVAERVCYCMVVCYSSLLTNVSTLPGEMLKCKNGIFSLTCTVSALPDFDRRWLNLFSYVTQNSFCCCCVAS